MWPLILLLVLIIPGTTLAQERQSILDDPNFLQDLGLNEIEEPQRLGTPPCPTCSTDNEDERILPFTRERQTGRSFSGSEHIEGVNCVTRRSNFIDRPQNSMPGGFNVCMNAGSRNRLLEFRATDSARDGAMMYFSENISPLDSQNFKTAVIMLPRRSIPHVRLVGGELHMTLSTGELVVLNPVTKALIRGPLSFGAISSTPTPTPFTYTGPAIVISATQRGPSVMPFEPRGSTTLTVSQNRRTCSINRERLFNDVGHPIAATDAAMVSTLNQFCTPRPANPFRL